MADGLARSAHARVGWRCRHPAPPTRLTTRGARLRVATHLDAYDAAAARPRERRRRGWSAAADHLAADDAIVVVRHDAVAPRPAVDSLAHAVRRVDDVVAGAAGVGVGS